MMICNKCNIEKGIDRFSVHKIVNGVKKHRKKCKDCYNEENRLKSNSKGEQQKVNKTNVKPKTTITPIPEIINLKDENEFIDLHEVVDKDTIINILTNRNNRVRTTFNLDVDIKEKLNKYCKQSKFNISDVVNILFNKFFE